MLSDCSADGSMNIGQRHWASHALICCNAAECAQRLAELLTQQDPDVLQGAMAIVSSSDQQLHGSVEASLRDCCVLAVDGARAAQLQQLQW